MNRKQILKAYQEKMSAYRRYEKILSTVYLGTYVGSFVALLFLLPLLSLAFYGFTLVLSSLSISTFLTYIPLLSSLPIVSKIDDNKKDLTDEMRIYEHSGVIGPILKKITLASIKSNNQMQQPSLFKRIASKLSSSINLARSNVMLEPSNQTKKPNLFRRFTNMFSSSSKQAHSYLEIAPSAYTNLDVFNEEKQVAIQIPAQPTYTTEDKHETALVMTPVVKTSTVQAQVGLITQASVKQNSKSILEKLASQANPITAIELKTVHAKLTTASVSFTGNLSEEKILLAKAAANEFCKQLASEELESTMEMASQQKGAYANNSYIADTVKSSSETTPPQPSSLFSRFFKNVTQRFSPKKTEESSTPLLMKS